MFKDLHLLPILYSAIIYLFILIGIRLLGKKELSNLSVTDLVFIMLLSEAVGPAMIGSDESLLGGLIAAATLMVINRLLKIFVYKSDKFAEFMEGSPSILIRNGKLNKKEMRKNKIKLRELEQAARSHGISHISKIGIAILEVDGEINILDDPSFNFSEKIEE